VQVPRLPLDLQPEAWNRLDDTITSDYLPMVSAFYGGVDMAHGSRVRGMADDDTLGMPTWHRIWVSP